MSNSTKQRIEESLQYIKTIHRSYKEQYSSASSLKNENDKDKFYNSWAIPGAVHVVESLEKRAFHHICYLEMVILAIVYTATESKVNFVSKILFYVEVYGIDILTNMPDGFLADIAYYNPALITFEPIDANHIQNIITTQERKELILQSTSLLNDKLKENLKKTKDFLPENTDIKSNIDSIIEEVENFNYPKSKIILDFFNRETTYLDNLRAHVRNLCTNIEKLSVRTGPSQIQLISFMNDFFKSANPDQKESILKFIIIVDQILEQDQYHYDPINTIMHLLSVEACKNTLVVTHKSISLVKGRLNLYLGIVLTSLTLLFFIAYAHFSSNFHHVDDKFEAYFAMVSCIALLLSSAGIANSGFYRAYFKLGLILFMYSYLFQIIKSRFILVFTIPITLLILWSAFSSSKTDPSGNFIFMTIYTELADCQARGDALVSVLDNIISQVSKGFSKSYPSDVSFSDLKLALIGLISKYNVSITDIFILLEYRQILKLISDKRFCLLLAKEGLTVTVTIIMFVFIQICILGLNITTMFIGLFANALKIISR